MRLYIFSIVLALATNAAALPGKVPIYRTPSSVSSVTSSAKALPVHSPQSTIDTTCTDESKTVSIYSAKSTSTTSSSTLSTTRVKPIASTPRAVSVASAHSQTKATATISSSGSTTCTDETTPIPTFHTKATVPFFTPPANSSTPAQSVPTPSTHQTTPSIYQTTPSVYQTPQPSPSISQTAPSIHRTAPIDTTSTTTIQSTKTIYSTNYLTKTRPTSPATYVPGNSAPAQSQSWTTEYVTSTVTVYPAKSSKIGPHATAIPAPTYPANSPVHSTTCPSPVTVTVTEKCHPTAAPAATVTVTETHISTYTPVENKSSATFATSGASHSSIHISAGSPTPSGHSISAASIGETSTSCTDETTPAPTPKPTAYNLTNG